MKNKLHIVVRLLVGIVAFQVLNMSASNVQNFEDAYLCSNATQTGTDPTESIIELVVEAHYGQQDMFTYKTNPETSKNSGKAFCSQIDLISEEPGAVMCHAPSFNTSFFDKAEKPVAFHGKIIIPPPEV